jgi:hypothetical protein
VQKQSRLQVPDRSDHLDETVDRQATNDLIGNNQPAEYGTRSIIECCADTPPLGDAVARNTPAG